MYAPRAQGEGPRPGAAELLDGDRLPGAAGVGRALQELCVEGSEPVRFPGGGLPCPYRRAFAAEMNTECGV